MLVLVAVWGVRLSAHIYLRNRGQGEDKRYASLAARLLALARSKGLHTPTT